MRVIMTDMENTPLALTGRIVQFRTMPNWKEALVCMVGIHYVTYPELTAMVVWYLFALVPVNQVPTFQMWREHLTLIAYELQHQHFERAAVRDHDIRGHSSPPVDHQH